MSRRLYPHLDHLVGGATHLLGGPRGGSAIIPLMPQSEFLIQIDAMTAHATERCKPTC